MLNREHYDFLDVTKYICSLISLHLLWVDLLIWCVEHAVKNTVKRSVRIIDTSLHISCFVVSGHLIYSFLTYRVKYTSVFFQKEIFLLKKFVVTSTLYFYCFKFKYIFLSTIWNNIDIYTINKRILNNILPPSYYTRDNGWI